MEPKIIGPKIKIDGRASLKEIYRDEKDKRYYASLLITAKSQLYYSSELTIDVMISEQQYNNLKKEISESKAEKPILGVKGELELILNAGCMN